MSTIKKIIPLPARNLYHRLNWFIANYRKLGKYTQLRSTHYHGPITYDTDALTTSNNSDFVNEPRFAKAYAAAAATNPWPDFTLQWRVYIVCWFADLVKKLDGDFVECGVNTGAYSRAIIEYINFRELPRFFYLLDTYEGLVPNQITTAEKDAGIAHYLSSYTNVYEQVKETFSPFENVRIIKGMVPDTLPLCKAERIAYLSIDMNVAEPEIAAANYFWDKLLPGAVMILDDYGFPQHINQKKAFDEFARQKGQNILSLPTAQGIIIKS